MATWEDARHIARSLPGAVEDQESGAYRVGGKLFGWPWLERVDPKRRRIPNFEVLVVRVASEQDKEILLDAHPTVLFTEPHYDGYAAVLVRLAEIDHDLLRVLLTEAWRSRAPHHLIAEVDGAPKDQGQRAVP